MSTFFLSESLSILFATIQLSSLLDLGGDAGFPGTGAASAGVAETSLWTEEARLTASNAVNTAWLGSSFVANDDTALVGAPLADAPLTDSGSAYVYTRSGTTWREVQQLVPASAIAGGRFGTSLALFGDTLLVGAPGGAGAAFVFERTSGQWVESFRIDRPDPLAQQFGSAVDLDDGVAIIGASDSRHVQPQNGQCFSGSAYIFNRTAGVWKLSQPLFASDEACNNRFGISVAIAGSAVLVGARSGNTLSDSGSVYAFGKTGGRWLEEQKLVASDEVAGAQFGSSLALESNMALIGAPKNDSACPGVILCNSGAVYAFKLLPVGWVEQQKVVGSVVSPGDNFGTSVALSNGRAAIGSPLDSLAGSLFGAAYTYFWDGSLWMEEERLVPSTASNLDRVGFGVAIGCDRLYVSSQAGLAAPNSGSVYVFRRRTATVSSRNAIPNPASYSCPPARLGAVWSPTVDLSMTGHTHAQVVGGLSPISTALPKGQVILVGGAPVFRLPIQMGPLASWNILIPNDCALVGLNVYSQGVHLLGVTPFVLSNAQDLELGF